MKILLIEDSPEIQESVALILKLRWPESTMITTLFGEKGVELVKKEIPDIVILDINLPDINGFQVLRQIRTFSNVPLVILTVKEDEADKIKGLELGADDYIVKPFSAGEFLARLKAVLRRKQIPEKEEQVTGKFFIRGKLRADFTSGEVSIGDKLLTLMPSTYSLLYQLMTNEGKVLSNQTLIDKTWGPGHTSDVEYLRSCITILKNELEKEPGTPTMIFDEGGTGYKFIGG